MIAGEPREVTHDACLDLGLNRSTRPRRGDRLAADGFELFIVSGTNVAVNRKPSSGSNLRRNQIFRIRIIYLSQVTDTAPWSWGWRGVVAPCHPLPGAAHPLRHRHFDPVAVSLASGAAQLASFYAGDRDAPLLTTAPPARDFADAPNAATSAGAALAPSHALPAATGAAWAGV